MDQARDLNKKGNQSRESVTGTAVGNGRRRCAQWNKVSTRISKGRLWSMSWREKRMAQKIKEKERDDPTTTVRGLETIKIRAGGWEYDTCNGHKK